jgi:hypothetical protein
MQKSGVDERVDPAFSWPHSLIPESTEMKRGGVARVRALAATMADVEEGTTFGFPAFKVRGKTFAWFPKKKEVEQGSLGVRMSIVEREFLIAAEPTLYYVTPHYHDYTSVLARIDLMSEATLRALLESGHEFIIADEKRRRTLKARRPPRTRS